MMIFAIELSSRFGSIALVENGTAISSRSWEENFKNRQQLFDAMSDLAIDWERVDCFAVGRGPGAFSGMRIGFSVVNSLAAPGGRAVYALNSGVALASRFGADQTVVVGDARRNQVWAGLFDGVNLAQDFRLMALDELQEFIPEGALVVSPDYNRLEALLSGYRLPDHPSEIYPTAEELGILVSRRLLEGLASEPFEPLYMHPPVFIAPRFPA